jgi:dihydropteroate synthase
VTSVRGLPQHLADAGRCLVMGVVNVTPDSFSDGGAFADADAAVERGLALTAQGADLVDVGGESTRPGADRVSAAEERRRVLPVVRALAGAGVVVSVDTMRADTAAAALEAGAAMVNDVSGGLADPAMGRLVAEAGVPLVVMHWRGHSERMQERAVYGDVVAEVVGELADRLAALERDGVDPRQLVVDPGLGFAKNGDHNWALLAGLDRLRSLGRPVLVGASRKGFLGKLLADDSGQPRAMSARDDASAAVTALAAAAGAWAVRVHEVAASRDAVRVAAALRAARGPG